MPAMARWKAWLCRLPSAGSSVSTRTSPAAGAASVVSAAIVPSSIVRRSPPAQPSGSLARFAWIVLMAYSRS